MILAYSPTARSGTTLAVGARVNEFFQEGRPCLEGVAALVQIVVHVENRLDPADVRVLDQAEQPPAWAGPGATTQPATEADQVIDLGTFQGSV